MFGILFRKQVLHRSQEQEGDSSSTRIGGDAEVCYAVGDNVSASDGEVVDEVVAVDIC